MPRHLFPEALIHPSIREKIAANHRDLVDEVIAAVAAHDVVVVGMTQNPAPKRARRFLSERSIPFHYLEYGSYLSLWRRRNALKMWTGWPTFPMIFVRGQFVGGASDLEALGASGELTRLLSAPRVDAPQLALGAR